MHDAVLVAGVGCLRAGAVVVADSLSYGAFWLAGGAVVAGGRAVAARCVSSNRRSSSMADVARAMAACMLAKKTSER